MPWLERSRRRRPSPFSEPHSEALNRLFDKIGDVSTLPAIAQQAIRLTADPNTTFDDLQQVIHRDPPLAAKVLQRVNSAFFGRPKKIGDLSTAVRMLGLNEIRKLLLTSAVSGLFERPGTFRSYSRENLWKHSVAVAHAASLVAKVNKSSSSNEAYTAGLLHHLGTILIDQYLHQDFRRILQKLAVDVPTCDVEQQVLTFDHGQLASHLARRWAFPRDICEALRFYLYLESYTGPGRRLAIILAIADYLCASFGWTSLGIANVPAPAASVCEELGLDEAALTALQDQVWTDVARDMA